MPVKVMPVPSVTVLPSAGPVIVTAGDELPVEGTENWIISVGDPDGLPS